MQKAYYFVFFLLIFPLNFSLASETLFGDVVIRGELGSRQVVLLEEGLPDQVLVDEKKLLHDISKLKIPQDDKDQIRFEAINMFEHIPNGISQTGIDLTEEFVEMTDYASNGGKMDQVLAGIDCPDEHMALYLDVPEEDYGQTALDIEVPNSFAERAIKTGKNFFNLGEIVSISANLDTTNDNPLHGGLMSLNLTEFGEGIEGDDRGFTFGMTADAKIEFKEGSVAFQFFSNLYSRLSAQEIDGRMTLFDPETGHVFTENLNHEGIRVSFIRDLNDKYFMRLEGEYATIDDISGTALDTQTMWHESWEANTVIYDHVDHFNKQSIISTTLGIGRKFQFYDNENFKLSAEVETGIGFSNLGNVANDYNRTVRSSVGRFGAPTRMEGVDNLSAYASGNISAQYHGFDMTVYGTQDTNETKVYGIDSGYTFNKGGKHEVRLFIGLSHDENVFTDLYRNDMNDSNLTHHLGLGYRLNF